MIDGNVNCCDCLWIYENVNCQLGQPPKIQKTYSEEQKIKKKKNQFLFLFIFQI
jgi:hypothetical protein